MNLFTGVSVFDDLITVDSAAFDSACDIKIIVEDEVGSSCTPVNGSCAMNVHPGMHKVSITNGQAQSSAVDGKYNFMPQVLSVSPASGSIHGGVEVTVSGYHLKYYSSITFGGCLATPVSANGAQAVFKTCALEVETKNVEICFDGACVNSGFDATNPDSVSFSLNSATAAGLVSGFFSNQMVGNGSYEVMAEFNGNMISCGTMNTINGDGNFACDFGTALAGSVSANFGLDGSGLEGQVSVDVTPEITVTSPTEGSLHGGATVTVSGAGFDEMSAIFVTVNGNQVSEILIVFSFVFLNQE